MIESYNIKKLSKTVIAGASDFMNYAKGTDPNKLFSQLIEHARRELGGGGYTGTIAEKGSQGLKILSTPMTYIQAQEYAYEHTERMDKYGPTWVIPISEEKVIKEQEITLEVRAKTNQDAIKEFKKVVTEKLKLKSDESVIFTKDQAKKLKDGSPPVTEKYRGETTVKYDIYYNKNKLGYGNYSKDEATSRIGEIISGEHSNSITLKVGDTLELISITFESKNGVKVVSEGAKLALWSVTAIVKKTKVGNISGYLFFGVAAD